jgi:hypothetical protein
LFLKKKWDLEEITELDNETDPIDTVQSDTEENVTNEYEGVCEDNTDEDDDGEYLYAELSESDSETEHAEDLDTTNEEVYENEQVAGFVIEQNLAVAKCDQCLCHPCITDPSNTQGWWETDNLMPSRRNSGLRKVAYRKYWTMLYHRQVWISEEYMARKVASMGLNPAEHDHVYHKRDLMPDCVKKLVRTWYPNLPGMSYMGHRWA